MTLETYLSLNALTKTFANGITPFSNLSLQINKGDCLSLIGPSGCGKSTILHLIAGLTKPSHGHLTWPCLKAGAKPDIAFVFQEATLMPWASVFDNIWLPLRLKGISKEEAQHQIEEALALVGLENTQNLYPQELSGGMKMRVSIARALITKPQFLLMDEPFAALDDITRLKLNDDLLHLKDEFGWTILFVTHSIYEAVYLSNRILIMGNNRLEELSIEEPYPRARSFRTSKSYTEYVGAVSNALDHASAERGIL